MNDTIDHKSKSARNGHEKKTDKGIGRKEQTHKSKEEEEEEEEEEEWAEEEEEWAEEEEMERTD